MSILVKIVLTVVLLVIGAVGLGFLKDLFGHGLPRLIWLVVVGALMVWVWTVKTPSSEVAREAKASSEIDVRETGGDPPALEVKKDPLTPTRPQTDIGWTPIVVAVALLIAVVAFIDSPWLQGQASYYYQKTLKLASSDQILRCQPGPACSTCAVAELVVSNSWLGQSTISAKWDYRWPSSSAEHFVVTAASPSLYQGRGSSSWVNIELDRTNGVLIRRTMGAPTEVKRRCMYSSRAVADCEREYLLNFAANEGTLEQHAYTCQLTSAQF